MSCFQVKQSHSMDIVDRRGNRSPSLNRSRHSSMSMRSTHALNELEDSRPMPKSNSRLSFADDLETDRSMKHATKSMLKSTHENGLSRERSNERSMSRERPESRNSRRSNNNSNSLLFETKHQAINKIIDAFQEPKNLKQFSRKSFNGGFYYNENANSIESNSYVLDLDEEANVYFTIQVFTTQLHTYEVELNDLDVTLLIVKDGKNLALKGLTENKIKNKWCARLDLKPGRYFLFPWTSGHCLKNRQNNQRAIEPSKFFQKDINNKLVFLPKFKDALSVAFDLCDLDSNGKLNQDELNWYTYLSAREEISDEEWHFVGQTVGFENGELTKEGFFKLFKLEAQSKDVNLDDIASRLYNMGFNKSLTIDQSCAFTLNVHVESNNFNLLLGEIYKLTKAEKFIVQLVEQKGNPKSIDGNRRLAAIEYNNNYWSAVCLINETENDLKFDVDSKGSENCVSFTLDLTNNVKVKGMKSKLGMFLTARNPNKEWLTRYAVGVGEAPPSSRDF